MAFTPVLDRSEVLALVVRKLPGHILEEMLLNTPDLYDGHGVMPWPEKHLALTRRLYEFAFIEVFMPEQRAGRHLLA